MAHKRAAGRSPKVPAKSHRNRRGSEESAVLGPNGQPVKEPSPSMPPQEELQGSDTTSLPPQAEEEEEERGEEEAEEKAADEEEADGEEEEEAADEEEEATGADELAKKSEPSPRLLRAKVKAGEANKPQVPGRRVWSEADEIRILEALAAHQGARDHAFYHSLIALLDDKTCNHRDVKEKIRSIERRFRRNAAKGLLPSGDHECRLHELCTALWSEAPGSKSCDAPSPSPSRKSSAKGKNVQVPRKEGGGKGKNVEVPRKEGGGKGKNAQLPRKEGGSKGKNAQVVGKEGGGKSARVVLEDACEGDGGVGAASVRRSFTELSSLYPYLAEEVKGYGELVKTAFENINDDQAFSLDARCKKQKIDRLNLEMHQAELTKTLLHTLLGKTN